MPALRRPARPLLVVAPDAAGELHEHRRREPDLGVVRARLRAS